MRYHIDQDQRPTKSGSNLPTNSNLQDDAEAAELFRTSTVCIYDEYAQPAFTGVPASPIPRLDTATEALYTECSVPIPHQCLERNDCGRIVCLIMRLYAEGKGNLNPLFTVHDLPMVRLRLGMELMTQKVDYLHII